MQIVEGVRLLGVEHSDTFINLAGEIFKTNTSLVVFNDIN